MDASPPGSPHPGPAPTTGLVELDPALAAVATLDARPVTEHLEVLEAAQTALRQVLDRPST